MSRHGTRAAFAAGCRCASCCLMAKVYASEDARRTKRVRRRATAKRVASVPLADATPFVLIVRELKARGVAPTAVARWCGVGEHTVVDLLHGKTKVRQATVPKLRLMLQLLPSESQTA